MRARNSTQSQDHQKQISKLVDPVSGNLVSTPEAALENTLPSAGNTMSDARLYLALVALVCASLTSAAAAPRLAGVTSSPAAHCASSELRPPSIGRARPQLHKRTTRSAHVARPTPFA